MDDFDVDSVADAVVDGLGVVTGVGPRLGHARGCGGGPGIPWRYLPHNFPPWARTYGYFTKWQQDGVFEQLTGLLRRLVRCRAFPFVVITSHGERQFPPAFLRRCVRLDVSPPREDQLAAMIAA
ncbi:transposase, partial [Streptomyces sp. NPDC058457]|uniref:transposase n=1 Tax=Streptomyces sp. NPDC058457 TaxID=3346507 RepID=UPI003652D9F2